MSGEVFTTLNLNATRLVVGSVKVDWPADMHDCHKVVKYLIDIIKLPYMFSTEKRNPTY